MSLPASAEATIASLPYVITLREIYWGVSLVAITMAVHGFGVLLMLRISGALARRIERRGRRKLILGLGVLILATWMLMVVHLFEVLIWALFFFWKNAFANVSISYYFALNEFTTLGSDYHLPVGWRLLEGCIATAGLLTFAWSTGALLPLLQEFQGQQLQHVNGNRASRPPARTPLDEK